MPEFAASLLDTVNNADVDIMRIVLLGYFGLLWLSIIIWVTRDSIHRSSNLLFQTFAILINILIPVLGVLLYLIIRPSKTNMEKYYEEVEHRLLAESTEQPQNACENCLTIVDSSYAFCPNCGEKLRQSCQKCKKGFPNVFHICPYCGTEQDMRVEGDDDGEDGDDEGEEEKDGKKTVKRSKKKASK